VDLDRHPGGRYTVPVTLNKDGDPLGGATPTTGTAELDEAGRTRAGGARDAELGRMESVPADHPAYGHLVRRPAADLWTNLWMDESSGGRPRRAAPLASAAPACTRLRPQAIGTSSDAGGSNFRHTRLLRAAPARPTLRQLPPVTGSRTSTRYNAHEGISMADSHDDLEKRLQSLEQEIAQLKVLTASEYSIALPISAIVGVIIYLCVIAGLPLPGDPGFWTRSGIGFGSALAGTFVLSTALEFVKASLKAIVEVAMCLLLFSNALAGALLWTAYGSDRAGALLRPIGPFAGLAIATAVLLFVLDALVLLVLYPLARTAGTDLEGNTGASITDLWKRSPA
jgi:hypothetical protein